MNISINENIQNIPGYIPGEKIQGAISLASNENPFGPSPQALEAIAIYRDIYKYPDSQCINLKSELASKYNLKTDNIAIGNGSDEILQWISAAVINKNSEAISANYTFPQYKFCAQLFNGTFRTVNLKKGNFNLDAICNAINPKTKIIFICNPNNPTGLYLNELEIGRFLKQVPNNILVVFDEAYFEYCNETDFPQSHKLISQYSNLIVLRTFSKAYGLAGLRVGYGLANPQIISVLNKARFPFNSNSMAQMAALACLKDLKHMQSGIKLATAEKRFFYECFKELNIKHYPSSANFIFIWGKKLAGLDSFSSKQGIVIRPMPPYQNSPAFRITVGLPSQNIQFLNILRKFEAQRISNIKTIPMAEVA